MASRSLQSLMTLCATVLLVMCAALVFIFDRPVTRFLSDFTPDSLPRRLSSQGSQHFEREQSFPALELAFKRLSNLSFSCLTPIRVNYSPGIASQVRDTVARFEAGYDLRKTLWQLKLIGIQKEDCAYSKNIHATNQIQLTDDLYSKQWENLKSKIRGSHFLLTTKIEVNSANINKPLNLNLGLILGASLVLWDGVPVAYFSEMADSRRPITISTSTPGSHDLAIVVRHFGLWPGPIFSTEKNFHEPDAPVKSAWDPTGDRLAIWLLIVYGVIFVFFSLKYPKSNNSTGLRENTAALSALVTSAAVQQALFTDHIQAILMEPCTRSIRFIAMLVSLNSVLILAGETGSTLEGLGRIYKKINKLGIVIESLSFTKGRFAVALVVIANLGISVNFAQSWIQSAGISSQFRPNLLILGALFSFGVLIILVCAISAFFVRSHIKEEADSVEFRSHTSSLLLSGIGIIIYCASNREFISSVAILGSRASSQAFFETHALSVSVGAGLVILISSILKEIKGLRIITSESTRRVLKNIEEPDHFVESTQTEFGTLMLIDLTNSTGIKFTSLARVSNILQSTMYRLFSLYTGIDDVPYKMTIGDAILASLQAPRNPRHGDGLLEKLVRAYSLYQDGPVLLADSDRAVCARLSVQSYELNRAVLDYQHSKRARYGINVRDARFKIFLTENYYFYGINSGFSNIDSLAIFKVAKSEKQIDNDVIGGFYVFPDLWELLELSYPGIGEFFEDFRVLLPDGSKRSLFQDNLPPSVKGLRSGQDSNGVSWRKRFNDYLEHIYEGELHLRTDSTGTSYHELSKEVVQFCWSLRRETTLEGLIQRLENARPSLHNFLEKNAIVAIAARVACKRLGLWSWDNPEAFGKTARRLEQIMDSIGVPSPKLVANIRPNDEALEPSRVIRRIGSSSTLERNRGVRQLGIARIKSEIRPRAMDEVDFSRQIFQAFLSRYEVHSVDSHRLVWLYLMKAPERWVAVMKEASKSKSRIDALLHYYSESPSLALNSLGANVAKRLNTPDDDQTERSVA